MDTRSRRSTGRSARFGGCRQGEMLRIQYRHVDWERHQIAIPGAHAKDSENRRAPFDPHGRLAPVLRRRAKLGASAFVFGSAMGEYQDSFKTAWESLLLRANSFDPTRARKGARPRRTPRVAGGSGAPGIERTSAASEPHAPSREALRRGKSTLPPSRRSPPAIVSGRRRMTRPAGLEPATLGLRVQSSDRGGLRFNGLRGLPRGRATLLNCRAVPRTTPKSGESMEPTATRDLNTQDRDSNPVTVRRWRIIDSARLPSSRPL